MNSSAGPGGNAAPEIVPGSEALSPWSMPRAAWIRVIKRVYVMIGFHEHNNVDHYIEHHE